MTFEHGKLVYHIAQDLAARGRPHGPRDVERELRTLDAPTAPQVLKTDSRGPRASNVPEPKTMTDMVRATRARSPSLPEPVALTARNRRITLARPAPPTAQTPRVAASGEVPRPPDINAAIREARR